MVGPKPWTFLWFLLGCFRFLEPLAPSICSSTAASVCVRGHRVCSRASAVSWTICLREVHDGRGRGTAERFMVAEVVVYWRGNPSNSLRQRRGVPCVPHPGAYPPVRAPTPQLEEGCLRDIPGGGCPRIFTRRAPTPELPPLDGISMPSDKTSQTSLWNPHRRKVKGKWRWSFCLLVVMPR